MTRIIGLQALVGPSNFIQAILIKQLGNLRTNWRVYMALQNSWKWSILIGIAFFNWHKWRYCRQQLRKRSIHALYMMFANAEYPDLSFLIKNKTVLRPSHPFNRNPHYPKQGPRWVFIEIIFHRLSNYECTCNHQRKYPTGSKKWLMEKQSQGFLADNDKAASW